MSEGRKKTRKSKLEVREDVDDYEQQSEPPDLQRYLQLLKADHNYHISTENAPEPIELAIKIEVEECDENMPYEPEESPSTSKAHLDNNEIHSVYQHISTLKRYGNRGICKKMTYSIDKILQTAEYTVSISPTIPNKILNICLRNLIGSYVREDYVENLYDIAVKNALLEWTTWCKVTNIRDPPLFYQCYICNLSWWHFYPFRQHIEDHPIKSFNLCFVYENTVSYLIAAELFNSCEVKVKYIETEGNCYHCSNDFDFHLKNREEYKCSFCSKAFSSCGLYKHHEGWCHFNRDMDEAKFCIICNSYISESEIKEHFERIHIVRSDIVVPVINQYCSMCKQIYHSFAFHVCSKSRMTSSCSSCNRKFTSRKQAELHNSTNLSNIACELCHVVLAKKCSQMEHMLNHTELFKLVYKCVFCTDIFVDEESIRLHRIHKHKQRADKRRCIQLGIPVPEICTREDAIEKIEYSRKKSNPDVVVQLSELPTTGKKKKPKRKKLTKTKSQSIAQYPENDGHDCSTATIAENSSQDGSSQDSSYFHPTDGGNSSKVDENVSITEYEDEKSNISFEEEKTNIEIMLNCIDPSNFDEKSINEEPTSNVEVTIETEPMEYEEVLSNVFKVSPEIANRTINANKKFDDSVKIKTEPIDEHEASQNPDKHNDISQIDNFANDFFPIGVTVKEEVFNQFEQENLTIKTEPMEDSYYDNDEHDFEIEIKTDSIDEETPQSSFENDNSKSNIDEESSKFDVKDVDSYYTPEIEYGESNDETDEVLTFNYDGHPYPCSKCNADFKSCKDYIKHLKASHALPQGVCPCCGEKVDKLQQLVKHLEKHVRHSYVRMKCLSKNFKSYKCINSCRICHQTVPKLDFFKHWEKHAYVNNMKIVHKTFTHEEDNFKNADKKMPPEMLARTLKQLLSTNDCKTCCVCQRVFSRRTDTKRHLIEHLLSDAFVKREYTRTLRCQHCYEDFHKPEHYKFHMRDHGGLTIYRCEICQKTFSDSSNFTKHSKVHNVRVLVCDMCNKKFNAKSSLETHITTVHQNRQKTEFPCKFCPEILPSILEKRQHVMRVHRDPTYRCYICFTVFQTLKQKWDHEWASHKIRKHQADCPICKKSFRKFSDVSRHAKEVHNMLVSRPCRDGHVPTITISIPHNSHSYRPCHQRESGCYLPGK